MNRLHLGLGILAFILLIVAPSFITWIKKQWHQIEEVQKFRTDFAIYCRAADGRIVRFYRASVSAACIGPDGRWIASY